MRILDLINLEEEEKLKQIPLGYIRKNATRMHAVCRFKPGPKGYRKTIEDVKEVAIHPEAVNEKWIHYARFLMFHEYLHAIGNIRHDAVFRRLENLWPDEEAKSAGKEFGRFLRNRAAKWLWTCPDITIIGIESIKAVAIPVMAFVAPGPDVTITTPGLPVALAYPSAA